MLQVASSTGGKVCLTGVRPHGLKPVVELCSAKVVCRELQCGVVMWFGCMRSAQHDLQADLAQSNVRASLANAAPNMSSERPSRVPCRPDHPAYAHL